MLFGYAVALIVGSAKASPAAFEQLARKGFFTLEQTPVELPSLSLPEAILRDYIRHGAEPPEELETAVRMHSRWVAEQLDGTNSTAPDRDGTTSVPLRPGRHDIQYLISIKIGKHNMIVDPDTGSSDLWVVSDLLPTNGRGNRAANRLYDTKGGGQKLEGHQWRIMYGDRSTAGGQVYLDTVSIGDLTVKKQAVEAASTMSAQFLRDTSRDGLLGLGFGKGNQIRPKPQPTWFENVREQLKEPVFTCSLKRRAVGTFDFGYVDKSKYQGDMIWHPVRGFKSHWDFNVSGIAVGNGPVIQKDFLAIADTGSSLWYMPDELTDAYWKKVPGATFSAMGGGWTFPCGQKLPDITVVVSGKKIVVPGINLDYTNVGGKCLGGLQRDLKGIGFSLFGDTFLKGLYVVHEAGKGKQPRIGFAISSSATGVPGSGAAGLGATGSSLAGQGMMKGSPKGTPKGAGAPSGDASSDSDASSGRAMKGKGAPLGKSKGTPEKAPAQVPAQAPEKAAGDGGGDGGQ